MQITFDNETGELKSRYSIAVEKVEQQSKTLEQAFISKVKRIKEKSALFFAQVELKLKKQNDEVLQVSSMYRQFQENIQGPTHAFDAHIHTLKTAVTVTEQDRITEFRILKDAV